MLLLSGCVVSVGSDGGGTGGGTGAGSPIGQVDRDDLSGDEQSAVGASDAFWRQAFPEDFRQRAQSRSFCRSP